MTRKYAILVACFICLIIIFLWLTGKPTEEERKVVRYSQNVRTNVREMLRNQSGILVQKPGGPLRPFVNLYSSHTVAPEYSLSACFVPKALSTTLNSIFCYLRDSEGFDNSQLDLKTVYWTNKFCQSQEGIVTKTKKVKERIPIEGRTFQIVRDPIRRFVSAFVNKCVDELMNMRSLNNTREVCYGCEADIECVANRAYKEMMDISLKKRKYQRSSLSKDYYTRHFMPLSWYCDISSRTDDVHYIRYEERNKQPMTEAILQIMQKSGVEWWKRRRIRNILEEDRPLTHATKGSLLPARYTNLIHNSPQLLNIINKMYYYDYQIYEIPIPTSVNSTKL